MLVTCLKCKKPVFVSSSAVSAGEAEIPCNACGTALMISANGSVRVSPKGAGAPPPPTPEVTAAPVEDGPLERPKPRAGSGSGGRGESFTGGSGTWTPIAAKPQPVVAPQPPPLPTEPAPDLEAATSPPLPPFPPPPDALSAADAQIPAPVVSDLPPPPAELDAPRPPALPPRVIEKPFDVRPLPSPPPSPPPMVTEQAAPSPPAPPAENEANLMASLEAVVFDSSPATSVPPEKPAAPPLPPRTPPRPVITPGLVVVEKVAADRVKPPSVGLTLELEPPDPGPPEPTLPEETEGWKVGPAPAAIRGPAHEGRHDRAGVGETGRAGTVPLDEKMFAREVRRGRRLPLAIAASVVVLAASGLWAAGLVRVPGVPQPPWKATGPVSLASKLSTPPNTAVAHADTSDKPPELPPPAPPPVAPPPAVDVPPAGADLGNTTAPAPDTADTGSADVGSDLSPAGTKRRDAHRLKAAPLPKPSPTKASPPIPPPKPAPTPAAVKPPPAPATTPATVRPPSPEPAPAAPVPSAAAASSPGDLHYQQGNLYLKEKKVALAIEEFKKCLAADPSYGVAYRSLGVAYMLLGREKSAIESYEKFISVAGTHRDAPKVKQIIDEYYRRNPK